MPHSLADQLATIKVQYSDRIFSGHQMQLYRSLTLFRSWQIFSQVPPFNTKEVKQDIRQMQYDVDKKINSKK